MKPSEARRRTIRPVRRDEPRERGVVIVYLALCLTLLLIFAAFMVDLGSWYWQGQDLQRAADAAALAASTYVGGNASPNGGDTPTNCGASVATVETAVPDSVYCSALKEVLKNGYTQAFTNDSFVTTTVDPTAHQVTVSLDQGAATSYFSSFFSSAPTLARSSNAVYSTPIPLGSPQNFFGTGDLPGFPGDSNGPSKDAASGPDFWAAIAGACAPAEMGDPVASYYDGNVGTGTVDSPAVPDYEAGDFTGNPNGSSCGNTAEETANPDFDGVGYLYDVVVPANGATLYVYNPAFSPCATDDVGNSLDIDWNYGASASGCSGTSTSMKVYYYYEVPGSGTWTKGTGSPYSTTVAGVDGGSPNTNPADSTEFVRLGKFTIAGTYLINISTLNPSPSGGVLNKPGGPDTNSIGTHLFSLLAIEGSSGPSTLPISAVDDGGANYANDAGPVGQNGNAGYACSTLSTANDYSANCPQIYADPNGGGAEAEILSTGTQRSATAYLSAIPLSAINHTVDIKLFDPGDEAQFIQIYDATGTPLSSFTTTASGNNIANTTSTWTNCQDPNNGNGTFTDPDTNIAVTGACLPVDQCMSGQSDTNLTPVPCTTAVTTSSSIPSGTALNNSSSELHLNIPSGKVYSGDQIWFDACGYQEFVVDGGGPYSGTNISVPVYSYGATTNCAYPAATPATAYRWGAPNNRVGAGLYSDAWVTFEFTVTPEMLCGAATCSTENNGGWFSLREVVQSPPVNDVLNYNVAVVGLPPHLTP
jgi:hypothetical protein